MMFEFPPADFNKQIDTVGCFVVCQGKFLLLQRQPHKSHGGKWGLPHGKVDDGETLTRAMAREIHEETGIEIAESKLNLFKTLYVRHDGFDLIWNMFFVILNNFQDVRINPTEHQDYAWLEPREALLMDLVHDLDEGISIFKESGLLQAA